MGKNGISSFFVVTLLSCVSQSCELQLHRDVSGMYCTLTHAHPHNHSRPVFCFGFVDILSGPESGPPRNNTYHS